MVPDFIENPTVDALIGVALLTLYEICTGHMNRAWDHLGIALRSISLLGLDIDPDHLPNLDRKSWIVKNARRYIYIYWQLYIYILDLCEYYLFKL